MRTTCYFINLFPSALFDGDVSERVDRERRILFIFESIQCKAFVHAPKEQRTKLDDKVVSCIFLDYSSDEFGYRLWDPENKESHKK